jgi:hypothetical protein
MNVPHITILANTLKIASQLKPLRRVTIYIYIPKIKTERKAILDGNVPDNLFKLLINARIYGDCNMKWYKIEREPFITFEYKEPII